MAVQPSDKITGTHIDPQRQAELEDLAGVGFVGYVNVSPDKAVMQLVQHHGAFEITLYSDKDHPGVLTPRDGMWRGAILSLAQRALTHQHKVQVETVRSHSSNVWMAASIRIYRGGK